MRGTKRNISLPRRFLIDFMHASMRVPAISFSRPLDVGPLMAARAKANSAPGWAAVFVKAFATVAMEEPVLRTLYVKLPWPHFFELPRSVAMVAVARTACGEEFIGAVVRKAFSTGLLLDLPKLLRVLNAATKSLQTDGFGLHQMLKLAKAIHSVGANGIQILTVPLDTTL